MSFSKFLTGKSVEFSNSQLSLLVVLRLVIGWHFLYEGLLKILNPNWTSAGYLLDSKGIFAGIFESIAMNPGALSVVDFLNAWGLSLVGLGLILGLFTQLATIGGIALLAFYYLSHPPLIGIDYAVPSEGNYLLVNKTIIEMVALWALYFFPTGSNIGIDRLIFKGKN